MIDWSRIADLREEIGEDDLLEVVGLFLEETDEVIARLFNGAGSTVVEAELHFLKGSALNLGFAQLAKLCQEGEHIVADSNAAAVSLAAVIDLYHRSKIAFLAGLVLDPVA